MVHKIYNLVPSEEACVHVHTTGSILFRIVRQEDCHHRTMQQNLEIVLCHMTIHNYFMILYYSYLLLQLRGCMFSLLAIVHWRTAIIQHHNLCFIY